MRWRLLLFGVLLFLVGCIGEDVSEEVVVEEVPEVIEEVEEIESYDLDLFKQEFGIRLNILRVEEVPSKNQIKFTVVVEEIIGNEENRNPLIWFADVYYGSGNILSLFQCGVERVSDNKWHASYCENFDVIDEDVYDDGYFVFTKQVNDYLEGLFIRDVDKLKDTMVIEMDLSDKFLGKR